MTRYIINVILCCLLGLSGIGCKDESSPCIIKQRSVPLSAANREKCPYLGTEEMLFINNKGDSVICNGLGQFTNTQLVDEGDPSCPTRVQYEKVTLIYKANKATLSKDDIYITMESVNNKLSLEINNVSYSTFFSWIVNFNYNMQINTNVGTKTCLAIGDSLYYNHTDGIIRLVQNDTIVWNRIF